jgi:hypothetical protein
MRVSVCAGFAVSFEATQPAPPAFLASSFRIGGGAGLPPGRQQVVNPGS